MNVLAVSAHPDDETLGCGGSLLAHRDSGDVVDWLILTRPDEERHSREVISHKARQVDAVADAYGMRQTTQLDFAAGRLDTVALNDIMNEIKAALQRAQPEVVYVVSPGDAHTDHSVAFRATMSVLKPFHMRSLGVNRVQAYETLSSTEAAATPSFVPNVYRDITFSLEEKLHVMSLYTTEAQPEPLPRSPSALRALARFRGATVGTEYAEAFSLIRELL
jgi:LmbE family N-acetylglucosaminyl deacetylase